MELGAYIKGMSFASAKDIIFLAIKNSQKTLKTLKLELLQTVSNTKNVIHSFSFVSMKCFGILKVNKLENRFSSILDST